MILILIWAVLKVPGEWWSSYWRQTSKALTTYDSDNMNNCFFFFSQGVSVGMGMTGMKDTLLAGDALDKRVSEIVKNQVWRARAENEKRQDSVILVLKKLFTWLQSTFVVKKFNLNLIWVEQSNLIVT